MEEKGIGIIKKIRYILIIVLILFICIFVIVNREEMNIDNFKRIIAQFDFAFSTSSEESSKIEFNAQNTNKYKTYKNGFVSLTEEGLKIYDKANNMLFHHKKSFSKPVLLTSRKYCLCYDFGNTNMFVTNSFANVFEHTFSGNISFAELNDDGFFAVVAKEPGYTSVMHIYNKNLEEILTVSLSEKYILYASISDNSKSIAYVTLSLKTGEPIYEINLLPLDKETPTFTTAVPESVIGIDFINGDINIIGKNNLYLINKKDGTVKKQFSFDGKTLKSFEFGAKFTMLNFESVDKLKKYQIEFVDSNMNKISTVFLDKEIYDISVNKDKCAVLLKDNIDIYNVSDGGLAKTMVLDQSYKEVLINSENDCFLIASEMAIRKNIDEMGG